MKHVCDICSEEKITNAMAVVNSRERICVSCDVLSLPLEDDDTAELLNFQDAFRRMTYGDYRSS